MCLEVEVEDTGVGLSRTQLSSVFRPFEQVEPEHFEKGGTGLGLAISQSFARMLGGDLNAKSENGLGCTFRLEVAVSLGHESELEAGSPADALINEKAPESTLIETPPLTREALRDLPDDLRRAMTKSVAEADLFALHEQLDQVAERDPELAAVLRALADRFEYATLKGLLT